MPSREVGFNLSLRVENGQILEDLARIHALAGLIRAFPQDADAGLNHLREQRLIALAGDETSARVDLMTRFTVPGGESA